MPRGGVLITRSIGRVIAAADEQAQVGHGVADFQALVEALTTVDAVGQALAQECLLEHPRLGVGAIENGHGAPWLAAVDPVLDLLNDKARLVLLVEPGVELDRLAVLAGAPQFLAEAPGVVRDDRVGGAQDGLRGAVVLLQAHGARGVEIVGEALDVLDLRAAPAVDRLVVVTDRDDGNMLTGQHPQPRVLDRVRVLELVDENLPETLLVMRQHLRRLQPQLVGAQQQLGEVHHAAALAGLLVGGIHALHGLQIQVAEGHLDVRRAQPLVLLPVDVPLCLLRRPARLVELQLAAHALHQAQLVIAVEDLEILRQARLLPVHFQQAVGEAVERADPETVRGHLQHVLDTPAHFPRRLVGKGHGENRMRRELLGPDQPGDAMHQHPCLSRPGTGQHQHVATLGGHRLALRIVETGENIADVHPRHSNRHGMPASPAQSPA
jgi:hypothetical protein